MIDINPEDIAEARSSRKREREALKRQIAELRALGLTVQAIASRLGSSEAAISKRIQRFGLADPVQGAAVRAGYFKNERRRKAEIRHHAPQSAIESELKMKTGPCCYPGCSQDGYGRRQLCEPHRWEVIDREMIDRRRQEAKEILRIQTWEKSYDYNCSDNPYIG